jgi:thiol peroxidase
MEIRPSQVLSVAAPTCSCATASEDAWIDAIVETAGNSKLLRGSMYVIEAARGIRVLKVPEGPVDRSMGDVHPLGSPHLQLDPANMPPGSPRPSSRNSPRVAPELGDSRRSPRGYSSAWPRLPARGLLARTAGRVVSHTTAGPTSSGRSVWSTAGPSRIGPACAVSPAPLGPHPIDERDPGRAILVETWCLPADTARGVARETGAKVVSAPGTPGAVEGTGTTSATSVHLVTRIADALQVAGGSPVSSADGSTRGRSLDVHPRQSPRRIRHGHRHPSRQPVTLGGNEVKPGQAAPDFTVTDNALQPVTLKSGAGKVVILSAVPSLDTPVCDTETRRFNQEAGGLGSGVEVWTISMDLPFAQKRWCGAAGVTAVKTLSDFRERSFAPAYGVLVKDGPLAGLAARAVFVVGKDGNVKHAEYVKDITQEPNYEAALAAARQAAGA